MSIEISMPELAPSMTSGTLVRWLKREGEHVAAGEVIAEVETDKAIAEMECAHDGVIEALLVADGTEGVAVGTPLLRLAPGAAAGDVAAPGGRPTPSSVPLGTSPSPNEGTVVALPRDRAPSAAPGAGAAANGAGAAGALPAPAGAPAGEVSPLRRALARQGGVAPSGGIGVADLIGAAPAWGAASAPARPASAAPPDTLVHPGVNTAAPAPAAAAVSASQLATHVGMPFERRPHDNMRRTIARRLVASKQTAPHFYLGVDCDMDALLQLRRELNAMDTGVRVTVNDLLVRIAALALLQEPALNVAWEDDALLVYGRCDIAVAVATPGGLLTPVLRGVERLGLRDISSALRDLGERARAGQLRPDEMAGGSMTLSNLGMYGVREAIAVINPPQAAILAVGASLPQAAVRDGELAVATRMRCSLSVDHRAVNGAQAARYLAAFQAMVENPARLVL